MRISRRIVGTVLGLGLLAASLTGCSDTSGKDAGAAPTTEQSATDAGAAKPPVDNPAEGESPTGTEDGVPNVPPVSPTTLPGPCANDVPLPRAKHSIVDVNMTLQRECVITIGSKGKSLSTIQDIDKQLIESGFTQTTAPTSDDGAKAVNTSAYMSASHEVHITVTQDGDSGVTIMYALTDPERGNG